MPEDAREQLIKHLTDAHSIEVQALDQMKRAPGLAGDESVAADFERHIGETERHELLVRQRLEALDASPSTTKDIAGRAGAWGMLAFAKFNPDTPGKLVAHAFSYEHMELAAYELLCRVAERAGDEETAAMAREIRGEEAAMAERLERDFDAAVEASVREQDPDDLNEQLSSYLADAHAIEKQAISLLEGGQEIVEETALASLFDEHLDQTRSQQERLEKRMDARGSSPSLIKDIGLRLGGLNNGAFFAVQPDTPAKLAGFAFAFEHLEVAAYEELRRVAERAGDTETASLAAEIADEERAMGARIAEHWDDAVEAAFREQGVA
jgi:ferritin-like metal-binding protein YciE